MSAAERGKCTIQNKKIINSDTYLKTVPFGFIVLPRFFSHDSFCMKFLHDNNKSKHYAISQHIDFMYF